MHRPRHAEKLRPAGPKPFDRHRQRILNVAKADFEPTLTATTRRNLIQSATTTSRLDGTAASGPRSDNTTFSVGASEKIGTGGTVSVTGNTTRAATNSSNSTLNPAFGSSASVSLSQPLLKGAGPTVAKANIERSKLGVGIASSITRAVS